MTASKDPESRYESFRERFPALLDSVHLASCSQGALSTDLTAALFELQHTMRDRGAPWESWMAEVDLAREGFAALIHADPSQVAVVSCASEAAYQVASRRSWRDRPTIVSTDMEFPSVSHVWLAQRGRGADVVHAMGATRAGAPTGRVEVDAYTRLIDERAGLVSVPLVSYRNGARMPVPDVVGAARAAGAPVFVDAYQACGVLDVDVRRLDCDYLVSGSLKYLLGLPGLAFLYVRDGLEDDVEGSLTGWFAQRDPYSFDPLNLDFAKDARRFQTGTPSIPSAYAANAGFRVLRALPVAAVERRVRDLTGAAQERLLETGERLFSPTEDQWRGPMVAVVDDSPDHLAAFLRERRIHSSPRGHVLRLSFHAYNNDADVEAVCAAIRDYRARRPVG